MKNNKKNKTIILIIFSIFSIILFSSIAYSAFSSTMNITGTAHARVEANARITDFKLDETVNATSSYEEFGKDIISTSISFKDSASAIYKIEVTNYGDSDIGIYNITGLPNGISYELIDYKLKDKICDVGGKCNTFAVKTFYIKFTGSNVEKEFTLKFNFKVIHNITYINFTGNYTSFAFDGESLSVNVSQDSPKYVYIKSDDNMLFSYKNNILTLNNISSDVSVEAVNEIINKYDYTGDVQTLTIPYEGLYKIELWGSGGHINNYVYPETVGKGAYTSGNIYLKENDKLYFYIGGIADFNGRGIGEASGGSGTDVRLTSGDWNNFNSLKSRIMSAGGGGGGVYSGGINQCHYEGDSPGDAGGLIGYDANYDPYYRGYGYSGYGGTQTSGGSSGKKTSFYELTDTVNGKFGIGGYVNYIEDVLSHPSSGGGSGYYGGGHGVHAGDTWPGAGGGSSFISGHNGCDAIDKSSIESNIIHTGQSVHYSGYKFTDTLMIDGRGYKWTDVKSSTTTGMPTFDGTSTMTGNTETGYAKITLLQVKNQYNIKYTNIDGTYQSTIYKGENLIVDFGSNAPDRVTALINGEETNFTYKNGVININNVTGNIEIKPIDPVYEFEYTGDVQTFTVPYNGVYKVELWGASGGNSKYHVGYGGKGGYVSGNIQLEKNNNIYVYVGEYPTYTSTNCYSANDNDSFNGSIHGTCLGGGGATDIRLSTSANWHDFDSLKSRIIVASGGGGGYYNGYGGSGGGLIGYDGSGFNSDYIDRASKGATQTSYNFGYSKANSSIVVFSGNGYYAGENIEGANAAGGSSFISGHNGCDAIAESSTEESITHTGQSIHYSGYKFTNTKMIDGEGYNWTNIKGSYTGMPSHDGTTTITGNDGNGYARITLIEIN